MKLEDIRKLCDEATPEPWHKPIERDVKDAQFMALARTLMPLLLSIAEAAEIIAATVLWVNEETYPDLSRGYRERLTEALKNLEDI